MTNTEEGTLQGLYSAARWDDILLSYCYGYGPAIHNRELWRKVDEYCTAHGITDDEYKAAVVEPEKAVIKDAQDLR